MHKLDRSRVAVPLCLDAYDHRTKIWDDLESGCKRKVREELLAMQGRPVPGSDGTFVDVRCAYCEAVIYERGHIEHFRRKNRELGFPELTFSWGNLFLSCDDKAHCGHFKDRPGGEPYDPNVLVKPDEDDPDKFLYFHSSGEVRPREGLPAREKLRAEETIRIFRLDESTLAYDRARAVKVYREMKKDDFEELASWSQEMRQEYYAEEIEATQWDRFATTIRHFLQRLS